MGRGDSSWQDRNHHISRPKVNKKTPTSTVTPPVDTLVGTEGYDYNKSNTTVNRPRVPQVGESIMNSGGAGANEAYDFSKGPKAVSTTTQSATSKRRKNHLKINLRGAGGIGRNIV